MARDDDRPVEPVKKKGGAWKIVLLILIILLLASGVIYAWAHINHPEWFVSTEPIPANESGLVPPIESEGNPYALLIFIGVGGALILIGYLIYKGIMGKGTPTLEPTKIPVLPDRALMLFKEHFAVNNKIQCRYNKENEVFVPANQNSIIVNDKLPYYHTATGDNFLLLEIEVREGTQQGVHSIIIPIDKGEDPIKGGYYRQDTHTPRFQFNLQKISFPMSSLQDKQDRLRFAMMDKMEDKSPDAMKSVFGSTPPISANASPNYITTPLDAEEGQMPRPRPDYRKRQYRRSPYYRR
ncbi:hypothetical protein ACFL96_13465 [Thermoproteota archaeon]